MVLRAINAIVAAAALVGAAGFQSQTTPSITSLLDRYAQGDFNAADLSRLDTAAWGAFAAALETAAPVWVQQGPASDSLRRRLIANSFALEVANVALDTPSRLVARRILGWACANVRRAPANDGARAWWTASVTALQRGEDWDFLLGSGGDGELKDGHLAHARAAIGDDPALAFAAAVAVEGRSWTGVPANLQAMVRRVAATPPQVDLGAVAAPFRALTSAPEVGAEATLRLAITELRRGQVDAVAFSRVAQGARDPFVQYVAELVGGAIALQQQRPSEAIASFRQALVLMPRAQSAGTMLVLALNSTGGVDAAREEAEALVTGPAAVDPWRQYRIGAGRHWPGVVRELRERLK